MLDMRLTIHYMGVPLDGPAWLFGDNESIVKSSTIPASTLNKRHNALSYHTMRSAISANIIKFCHIPGDVNISNMLTKHLEPCVLKPLVKLWPIWRGSKVIAGPKLKESSS